MSIEIMEATANLNLAMAIQDYAAKNRISIGEARTIICQSEIMNMLYDYDTGLWGQGPDAILDELENK